MVGSRMEELEDTDSDATTCDPDWVNLSSDVEVIPDTQYSSTPHPLTPSPPPPSPPPPSPLTPSPLTPSPPPPSPPPPSPLPSSPPPPSSPIACIKRKSKEPLCTESKIIADLRLQNGAACDWSSDSGRDILKQPLVQDEEVQLRSTPDQVVHVVSELGMEWCTRDRKTVGVGAEKGRIVQEDSDYCSGTEQAFSRNEPLSAKNSPPLQKDMGFDEPLFERPRFPHFPHNPRRPLVLSPPGLTPVVEVPGTMNQYLRDYQQEGVQFLYSRYSSNAGGVLCDDMGLGKTVQVIAFMCAVLGKTGTKADVILTNPRQPTDGKGCFLVVCPSSVLYNWTSEIEAWSHLKCGVYHRGRKSEVLDRVKRCKLEVVVTTHDTARTHVEELNTVNWLAVICDEVQTIKGTSAQVTAAMNSLQAKRRFGLTGTALQNNLSELWSILNWANPGCLGTLSSFHDNFEKPILEGQKFDCTKRELAQGRWKLAELEGLMEEYVLRRTKALIASQLPKKEEFVVFCPITELQETIYSAILDSEDVQLILHSGEPCNCYSGSKRGECCYQTNGEGVEWQHLVNEYVCLLTKCANHLGLLLPDKTPSKRQKQKANQVCQEVFSKHPIFTEMSKQASLLTLSDPQYCGKMKVLEKLLSKFQEEKSKVIIFSISVKLLDVVENYLVSKGHVYCRLDGSTKVEERASLVRSFNADPTQFVFLISKKCGGVGLNITGANRVIIFDPSWNPATDLQAEDRAFRIGQSRDVKVYRFISEATVEENIYLRQVYKQQLANMTMEGSRERRYFSAVAGDRRQQGELFGYANLFKMQRPGSNLTLDILKRADRLEAGVRMAADQLHVEEESETKQMCSAKSGTVVQGATVLVHSGGRSVVGNSRVEEHISKQALTDVYELKQHSQEPANIVENKMEEFSDESDDVDYQPPPPKKHRHSPPPPLPPPPLPPPLPVAMRQTGPKKAGPSILEQSCKESKERRALKHENFGRAADKFGYSSSRESALHVRDVGSEERQPREFYGEAKKAEGKGKERLTVATTPPAKRGRRLPVSVTRRPNVKRRKMRKPALEYEDYSPPSTPTKTSPNKKQESPEVCMDTSAPNFTPLEFTKADRHPPSPKARRHHDRPPVVSDHTQVDLLLSPSLCTEGLPSPPPPLPPLGGNCSTTSSAINELLFGEVGYRGNVEFGYHGNKEVKATSSKTQTKVDTKFKCEPSIDIDELFGF